MFEKEEVRKLFSTVNDSLGDRRIDLPLFQAAFDGTWLQLDGTVRTALAKYTTAIKPKYDVFLSVPMAALTTEKKYADFRREAMKVFQALRQDCGLTVHWAMENIASRKAFDTRAESAMDDLRAIQQSASFLMLFPEKLVSGAIFEAGFALALGKPTRIFVKEENHLPFVMQELPQIYSNVAIYDKSDWTTYAQIAEMLVRYKDAWFKPGTQARMDL